jgi:hypothetical protein
MAPISVNVWPILRDRLLTFRNFVVMARLSVHSCAYVAALVLCQSAVAGGMPESAEFTSTSGKSAAANAGTTSYASNASSGSSGNNSSGATSGAASGIGSAANGNADGAAFVAIEDDPLIVDVSDIADSDGMGNAQLQWQISTDSKNWINISGAVQQSFTPREIHVGKYLRVVISYVDGQGKLETLISPPSSPVKNVNDKPTGTPRLSGVPREKGTLVVDTSLISDEDGIGNYEIIWQQSETQNDWQMYPNADGGVLQLQQRHVGYSYRAVVSYVDRHGTREVLATSPSEIVVNVDDPVEGEVTIVGKAIEGETLGVDTSTIYDLDGIASLSMTWESSRDGRNWETAQTASPRSLALNQSLVGNQIRARVSVVDTFGVESILFSKPSVAVKNINNKPAGKIIVRRVGN